MAGAKGEEALKLARTFLKFIIDGKGFDQVLSKVCFWFFFIGLYNGWERIHYCVT